MDEINISKCKYFNKFYETNPSGYGFTFEDYCFLYKDCCDKHPECIYRANKLQELQKENETLKQENMELKRKLETTTDNIIATLGVSSKAIAKLEKVKIACGVLGYTIGDTQIIKAEDILKIIDGEE